MPKYHVALREEEVALRCLRWSGRMFSDRCVFLSDFTTFFSTCVCSSVIYSSFSESTQVSMLEDVTEKLADVLAISDSHDIYQRCMKQRCMKQRCMKQRCMKRRYKKQRCMKQRCMKQRYKKQRCTNQRCKIESCKKQSFASCNNLSYANWKNQKSFEEHKSCESYYSLSQYYEKCPNKDKCVVLDKCICPKKCGRCMNCNKSSKTTYKVDHKRQETSCKKHKIYDKSNQKYACKIHGTDLQKHKNQSNGNCHEKDRHGDHQSCLKQTGNKHVYNRHMKKMKVSFVVSIKQKCSRSLKRKMIETVLVRMAKNNTERKERIKQVDTLYQSAQD